MLHTKALLAAIAFMAAIATPFSALATQSVKFGNYIIQYSALTTDNLEESIAKIHHIKRGRNRMMLNIVVQEKTADKQIKTVKADVTASTSNILGQIMNLDMRPIREGEAIYYIGESKVTNKETVNFTVHVKPEDSSETHTLSFRQQFFTR